jgi:polar amino acid transport system permease protein
LTSVGQAIESNTFRSFEVYGVVILLYLAMSWTQMQMFAQISARYLSYPVK